MDVQQPLQPLAQPRPYSGSRILGNIQHAKELLLQKQNAGKGKAVGAHSGTGPPPAAIAAFLSETNLAPIVRDWEQDAGAISRGKGGPPPPPPDLVCSLSLELMAEPVSIASGHTYERAFIARWLADGHNTCPKSNAELAHTELTPNEAVRAAIARWCESHNLPLPDAGRIRLDAAGGAKESEGGPVPCLRRLKTRDIKQLRQMMLQPRRLVAIVGGSSSPVESETDIPLARQSSGSSSGLSEMALVAQRVLSGCDSPTAAATSILSVPSDRQIKDLVLAATRAEDQGGETESCRGVAEELWRLSRISSEARMALAEGGSIPPLVGLLTYRDPITVERAMTALLNLSLEPPLRGEVVREGVLAPLIRLLSLGSKPPDERTAEEVVTEKAWENAAGTLTSLAAAEDYRIPICAAGALKPLFDAMGSGPTLRGRRDAIVALFNLAIDPACRGAIVSCGGIQKLLRGLETTGSGTEEEAVALVGSLCKCRGGHDILLDEGGVSLLVGVLEWGSHRSKANAVSALLVLAKENEECRREIMMEGALPYVAAVAVGGTARAKEKASALVKLLRN